MHLSGAATEGVKLLGNQLSGVKNPLSVAEEIRGGVIQPGAGEVEYSEPEISTEIKSNEGFRIELSLHNKGDADAFKVPVSVDGKPDTSPWLWLEKGERRKLTVATSRLYQAGHLQFTGIVKPGPAAFELADRVKIISPGRKGGAASLTLLPGEEREVTIEQIIQKAGPWELRVNDLPVWPFATFTNSRADFFIDGEKISIRAERAPGDEVYSAVYRQGVEGDFLATVKVLGQKDIRTYGYPHSGLMVRNQIDQAASPGGMTLSVSPVAPFADIRTRADLNGDGIFEASCGAAQFYSYPVWLMMEKRGKTLIGYASGDGKLWHKTQSCSGENANEGAYEIASVLAVQDVGVYGDTVTGQGIIDPAIQPGANVEQQAFDFESFRLQKPVPEEVIEYQDFEGSPGRLDIDQVFEASATVRNAGRVDGLVKADFFWTATSHTPSGLT
ncbi:MAG: hypothetical protein EXQ58_00665 [Acidobacteria bacterium]|nr:hypothetical protein [Acidobacteriota bacterium]